MNFDIQAPEKALYKFNEVTSLTGVKPYVLRFWETEFNQIQPGLNEQGQKIYRPEDLEVVQEIKRLLFEDKLSIPEAKAILDKEEVTEENVEEALELATPTIKSKSEDLKMALEQIIENNSRPLTDNEERKAYDTKAQEIAEKVKTDLRHQSHLADRDVLNLVTAKKKLTVLLSKIDNICDERNW
tara:strand:+ start:354 stop:908 length:555 start_codon:yes stop_codon:yes gene_type:complete